MTQFLYQTGGFHKAEGIKNNLVCDAKTCSPVDTVERQLSGLVGTASHPDMHEIRIIGFFLENMLQREFEIRLLQFTACTCA